MNVIFHTSVAVAITVSLIDADAIEKSWLTRENILTGILAFVIGVIFHGILDYIPHCYPVNSKLDVIASLLFFGLGCWLLKKNYRLIFCFAFIGSIFPDVIDLSFKILNKQLSLHLPMYHNFFPWHWTQYSGSIYNGLCGVSTLNHVMIIFLIGVLLYRKRSDLNKILNKD